MKNLSNKTILYSWLSGCRKRGAFESEETIIPPTKEEIEQLINYLRQQGCDPSIVGSVAVLKHLEDPTFRPTHDVDIHINKAKLPPLLSKWRKDEKAVGTLSWISPSGGTVDFLYPGYKFPSGEELPSIVSNEVENLPIADIKSIFQMKLNSFREKDFSDLAALVEKIGKVPTEEELGSLNQNQKENLNFLKVWIESKKRRVKQ